MELYHAIREVDPEQARRMVFVTAGAFTATARAFLESIANRRIDKPFEVTKLRAAVHELLR
jgi:hypothetical protein